MIRVALDAMGGDNAPAVEIEGVAMALAELPPSFTIQLVGKTEAIEAELKQFPDLDRKRIEIHEAPEVIGMGEKPLAAVRKKRKSSLVVGLGLQKSGHSDAFVSAGNTGAVLAAGTVLLGLHAGVDRATVATMFPTADRPALVLDAGANVDCSARELVCFAHLGTVYARDLLGQPNPAVGLLNIGEEDEKGNAITREAHQLLKQDTRLNYVGNIEGRDILTGHSKHGALDVIVTDGFVGNVVLKFYESVARMIVRLVKRDAPEVLERKDIKKIFRVLDYSEYGGAPLLGVQGVCIICHGSSSANAVKNAIRVAVQAAEAGLSRHIGAEFAQREIPGPGMIARPFAEIAGLGIAVPDRVVTNADFEKSLDTSDQWIVERTGIRERRIAGPGESLAMLSKQAAEIAMERAGITASDLDAIVLGTATPDRLLPSTACDLQALLGADNAGAFDISAACPGFIYAITVAEGLIAAGQSENVLVVGAEKLSTITDMTDRSTAILFGDGAGAAIIRPVSKGNGRGILSTFIRSDGKLAPLLYRPGGGACDPISDKVVRERSHYIKMAGREVFKAAVLAMSQACDEALSRAGVTSDQIDLLVPHQANIRIIEATAKHAGIPMEKVMVNVDRYGNTSSASIPLAIDQAVTEGRIKPGSLLLLVAFGAGFTWGSVVVRW